MIFKNTNLFKRTRFMESCGGGWHSWFIVWKFHDPNQNTKRKKNEESKGEITFIYWCFTGDPY